MKIRCLCGRFMSFAGRELAAGGAGGREEYQCRHCQARAIIWHAHGVDDWPVGGLIYTPDGREDELIWDDVTAEWRAESMFGKFKTFLCTHCGRPVTPNEVVVHFRTHYRDSLPYVTVGNDYIFLVRDRFLDNGRPILEFADPQPPRAMLEKAAKEHDPEMPPGKYPLNHNLRKWILQNPTVWEA
jgi:5-methylcytosine-specific restriction endonuclease McrA